MKGHKHFLVSDLMGIVMGVEITPANTGEREGGKVVLKQVEERYPMLENAVVYVDTGFDGPEFAGWVKAELGWEVRVVRKCSPDKIACCEDPNPTPAQIQAAIGRAKQSGFVLLPKRWVIERTNAWMAAQRRLRVVYDSVTANIRGWNWLTMLRILLQRAGRRNSLNAC